MQLKEEWRSNAKNKGEPLGPPSFLFEPCAALGSVPTVALSSATGSSSIAFQTQNGDTFRPCDGVDSRRLPAREYLRLPASSMCPLDLAIPARRNSDYGAAWSPAGRSKNFISVGRIGPSADVPYGPRESTKGRVEARLHVEKNDRTDLAEEVVTREQVEAHYERTTAEQKAKTNY